MGRECQVKTLYIIGNGFDCFGHELHTRYIDFTEEISQHMDIKRVRWYFNQFDWKNNRQNIEYIKELGF